ncbi:cysteine--1-D-myo-inosityl 2-amino-2-deoxy-alpha-D-glucopyranoside ligase [uncultured Tessaracoccus sp.]|uniref:cysteine--1-D-myo-inosityl 2-amino-2-deoxy-alpha-D-glucopyranoside ligase n=1 Tax=uncultured Tessaracoccus sp. TaxID=905023 RepID=UPI0025DDE5A8|nr:cysteine--1-D-myo-inosityl 2-amino-2-deoxy-alpha-D-glucopyranoside ligase [uncultured Tessaracoccus sp.]
MYSWAPVTVPGLPPSPGAPDRLRLFDTATGELVPAGPEEGTARLYVCGITPYDATHLGHAATYLAFDLVQRQWLDLGLEVNVTQNVTDVDDPLLERAAATGQDWDELAADQIELFRTDMEALRVLPPTHYVGAVESIGLVADLVEQLDGTGYVYRIDDPEHPDWYFRTHRAPGFGDVSGLDEESMVASFRDNGGDPDRPGKDHPLDALLWRQARDGEPAWESRLGPGRPGWHVECVAIAMQHLGPHFDVQGGGRDLVFPHHEMCAAEARALTGEPLAKAYHHVGLVGLDGEKMSKSKGNLELVSRLRREGADPMAVRLAMLAQPHRADWEWSPRLLDEARARLERWRAVRNDPAALPFDETLAQVRTALRTDLDAPAAIAAVDAWVAASQAVDGDDTGAVGLMTDAVDALLGIRLGGGDE